MIAANSAPEPGDEDRGDGQDDRADDGQQSEPIQEVGGQDGESAAESAAEPTPEDHPKKVRKPSRRDRPRGIDALDKALDEDKKRQHWHRWKISEAERRSVIIALLKIIRTKNTKNSDKLKAVERLQEIDRLNIEAEKKGPPPVEGSTTPIQDAVAELERKAVELDSFARRILIAQAGQPGDVCMGEQRGKVDSSPPPPTN